MMQQRKHVPCRGAYKTLTAHKSRAQNCLLGKCDLRTKRGREESVYAVWDQALDVIRKTGRASVAHFQRQLCIRYTVAVSLVDELEKRGIVGPHRLLCTGYVNVRFV